jgi:hypothetical protein
LVRNVGAALRESADTGVWVCPCADAPSISMIDRVIVGLLNIESPSQKLKSEYQSFRAAILCDSAQKEKNKGLKKVTRGAEVKCFK